MLQSRNQSKYLIIVTFHYKILINIFDLNKKSKKVMTFFKKVMIFASPAHTTNIHKPSSNNERNLIILQVNINGINNKLEELKTLIKNTHADIITIQETKLTSRSNTPKVPIYTTVRADRPHKSGGGLITLIRDNITFTPTDISSTINTHNIELQMVKVHLNNTKHITIAYIPPRDSTSTHYKSDDKDIQHCIQHITTIPHSVLTGDVNAHSSLWHSYTDDQREQLIAEVISNSDYISLNTDTPTRVPNTAFQQTSSPDITTVSNTLYNRTSWQTQHALSSDHLPIMITKLKLTYDTTSDYRLTDGHLLTTRKLTGHNSRKTQS